MIIRRTELTDLVEIKIVRDDGATWNGYTIICPFYSVEDDGKITPPIPHIFLKSVVSPQTNVQSIRDYADELRVVADEADKLHQECLQHYEAIKAKQEARSA